MLYSRQFINACREHKQITGLALNGSLDATDSIPMGGTGKRDLKDDHGDVVVENVHYHYTRREQ